MRILDLGCGKNRIEYKSTTVIGVDIDPDSHADVIHDLNVFPYPFQSDEFDEIICFDILEHLKDIPSVIREIHRIGRKGAVVEIRSPHFSSAYAYLDPTHIRGFSIFSFDHFCKNKGIRPHNIDWQLFLIRKRKIVFPKLSRIFLPWLCFLANKFPLRYEQYLAFILQSESIYLELQIVK